jgi:hypothetical protein
VVVSPDDWIWRQLGEPLSALFEGAAHLAPTVSQLCCSVLSDESSHSPSPAGFVYLRFFWTPAPFLFSSVWPYQPVAIAVLVYLQFTWGSAPPPLSGRVCLMSVTVGSFPLSKHAGRGYATLAFSGRLATQERASPPYSRAQGAPPSLLHVLFFSCLFIIQVFFLLGGGQSVQGAMLIFLKGGCERTACCLFLTCGSAKQVRSQHLAAWEPSCFSIFCDTGKLCGEAMCGLVVQRCQHLASSWWVYPVSCVSSISRKFLL